VDVGFNLLRSESEGDETNAVNKSHVSQQYIGAACIEADAMRSMARIKAIVTLYGMHYLHLDVGDETHAAIFKLNIDVKLCKVLTKRRNLPVQLEVVVKDSWQPLHMLHSTRLLPTQLSFDVAGMHRCS
jgi:hypothetical protein